ncbi:hypothetical protein IJU97_05660 [bacterium]|nr:hypothetical protein [bacterium]
MREVTAALENYDKSLQFLKEVIEDYLKKQTQLKALEEEEKRLNVLY